MTKRFEHNGDVFTIRRTFKINELLLNGSPICSTRGHIVDTESGTLSADFDKDGTKHHINLYIDVNPFHITYTACIDGETVFTTTDVV